MVPASDDDGAADIDLDKLVQLQPHGVLQWHGGQVQELVEEEDQLRGL